MKTVRRALVAVGILVMGYAVISALIDRDVNPFGVLVFLGGVIIGHDAVLLPLVIGVGVLIGRYVPAPDRATVRVAALCSLPVTIVGLPLALGFGRRADDPSALPLPYGRGLLLTLAIVWAPALAVIVVRRFRTRPDRPTG